MGERVLEKGTVLQPQDIGILVAIGVVRINVMRKSRVAILSTGKSCYCNIVVFVVAIVTAQHE